jgi:hypothetical protein
MGLLGSQAGNEQNCLLWILSNIWGLFFHVFMGKNLRFRKQFYIVGSALKRASCFGFRVKGVCPLLLPLVSLSAPLYVYSGVYSKNQHTKGNYWTLSFGLMASCQKVPKFDIQSQFSMSKIIRIFLNFFFIRSTFFFPTQDQNHQISGSKATWNLVVLVQVGL